MNIIINENDLNKDSLEITIKCKKKNKQLYNLVHYLENFQQSIPCILDKEYTMVMFQEILYIEVVENKTFVYSKKHVYQTHLKLYELEELLTNTSFIRISKAMIMNVLKVKKIVPGFNSRFEAQLENNEKIIISRTYVPELKKQLGLLEAKK